MSGETLRTALMMPKQSVELRVGEKNVMSVDIPVFETKTRTADANDIYSYGFAFTSSDLDGAVKHWSDLRRYAKAGGDGKGMSVNGVRDREDETPGERAGTCHYS